MTCCVFRDLCGMGSETTKKLILSNATAIIVNKMPSETNSSDDNNQHHVQFSKKTEVIPVNIIENNAKMSDIVDDEDNNQKHSQDHDTEQKHISYPDVKHDFKHLINHDSDCSSRQSDDSDGEIYHSKPRSILKHKPNCVVIVHKD